MSVGRPVAMRLSRGFTSEGLVMAPEQLTDPLYIVHGFLQDLSWFPHAEPAELEVRVGDGPWRRLDNDTGATLAPVNGRCHARPVNSAGAPDSQEEPAAGMEEWLDVEYRVAPVSGLVRVGARGVPGSPPLADVVFDSVREALRRSPGLVAVRPAGVGAVWDCIEPEAAWQPAVLEVAPGRLTLNPHQVRDLPTEHTDVGPGDVMYAEPLWAIAKDRRGRDWLEAAVRAGMVPHQEGIELAQQGLFLFTRSQVQDYIDQGELGEANGSLMFADAYRRFATLLLEEAAALERWRDELFDGGAS